MNNDKLDGFGDAADLADNTLAARPAALELAAAKYRADVEEFEMTDAQKAELLETLWSIMRSFVELGFSVNICEQILENAGAVSGGAPDGVKSLHSKSAAETPSDGTGKESA
jgi:hypothetical protein